MIYDLPTSLTISGADYDIRSDFRPVLDVIAALNDVELSDQERAYVALHIFYPDFEDIPSEHIQEALNQCFWFINGGRHQEREQHRSAKLMDWEQDFQFIISPVNRVIGREIRADSYLHWWTFLGAYMEIGDCTFAQIVHIRDAKAKGVKLSKQEQEWYSKNRKIVDLESRYTPEEDEVLKLWGGVISG